MSSSGKRRLDRLEAALVPMEAMALWLQDVRQHHRSLEELVHSLRGKPEEAFPLFTLTQQAGTGARARAKQQGPGAADWSTVDRAERTAVRDVAMLFYLFMGVNGAFLAEKRALCLLVALLLHSVRDCLRDDRKPPWADTRERLESAVEELYGGQRAVDTLSERYFQGVCPLMPETEDQLGWIVGQGEWLVEMFNDHLEFESIGRKASGKKKAPLPKPLDLAALKASAEPRAKRRFRTCWTEREPRRAK